MSDNLVRKASMYIKRMNSDQLKEVMQTAHDRFVELEPTKELKYCWLDQHRIFWALWDRFQGYHKGDRPAKTGIYRTEKKRSNYADWVLYERLLPAVCEEAGVKRSRVYSFQHETLFINERTRLKNYYRKMVAETKAAGPKAKTTDMGVIEYVYASRTDWDAMVESDGLMANPFNINYKYKVQTHRIIKKTKKCIYVSKTSEDGDVIGYNNAGHFGHFVLDREAIERDGKYYSGSAKTTFYKDKKDAHVKADNKSIALFEMLDIDGEFTKKTLRSAYLAKAKELHPDQGGDAKAFIRLKESYEAFMDTMGLGRHNH